MPAPLDLTGRVFGKLTVVKAAGRVRFGREQTAWLCRCACGVTLTLPQNRLPHRPTIGRGHAVTACDACRRGPCVVCGGTIGPDRPLAAVTCSDDCRRERDRHVWRSWHHRKAAADPDHNRRRHEARKARAAVDPEYAQRLREIERRAKRRSMERHREQRREWQRRHYAEHAAEIQARRRARLEAMTPEQRQRWMERARGYCRAYAARFRAELRTDPARHAAYLDLVREWRRQRALCTLMSLGAELDERARGHRRSDDDEPDRD